MFTRKFSAKKRVHPEFFRILRNQKSHNWTSERVIQGLCADRFIAADPQRQQMAWQKITQPGWKDEHGKAYASLKMDAGQPVLDLLGNMELLKRQLVPLICHRADAHRFEEQKAKVMKAATEGAVVVTAGVSPKEREIVKFLHEQHLPVIEVMGNGFAEKYKPSGKASAAVDNGLRLEVSPWAYESLRSEMRPATDKEGHPLLDENGEPIMERAPQINREMCLVMNEVVRLITKKSDDWWKNAIG